MDQLPALGTSISDIAAPTFAIYLELLAKQAGRIKSTKCDTYTYGPHPRQNLDVYTPSASANSALVDSNAVLVFLYGGGLVRGDKALNDLVYANVGHYFSESLGIKVVVVNYRLISHGAQFPSGAEDLALALEWISQHLTPSSSYSLDLHLMGNSAGGVHVATYLLSEELSARRQKILPDGSSSVTLRSAILLSVPLHFQQAHQSREEHLRSYFGSEIDTRCPLGLLKAAKKGGSLEKIQRVPMLIVTGSLDPQDEILTPNSDFTRVWLEITGASSRLTTLTIDGHNHISPVLAVGTAIPAEEAWGKHVTDFIAASSTNSRQKQNQF